MVDTPTLNRSARIEACTGFLWWRLLCYSLVDAIPQLSVVIMRELYNCFLHNRRTDRLGQSIPVIGCRSQLIYKLIRTESHLLAAAMETVLFPWLNMLPERVPVPEPVCSAEGIRNEDSLSPVLTAQPISSSVMQEAIIQFPH